MKNPITSKVNGTLTCEAFPRGRGRYEVVCSYLKPTGELSFASHGIYPGKEAALEVAKEVAVAMRRNPLHVCYFCGAKIYGVGKPVFCPACKKPWREKNPKKVYRTIMPFPSKSDPSKSYTVKQDEQGSLSCNCPTWLYRPIKGVRSCAHIRIVMTEYRHLLKNPKLVPIKSRNIVKKNSLAWLAVVSLGIWLLYQGVKE